MVDQPPAEKKGATAVDNRENWEPKQGEYRSIFSVPTRVPPEFSVEFVDPKIKAEMVRTTKSELRFRARGPAGYLKSFQSIKLPLKGYAEL